MRAMAKGHSDHRDTASDTRDTKETQKRDRGQAVTHAHARALGAACKRADPR